MPPGIDPYGAGVAIGRPRSIKTAVACTVCVVLDTQRTNRGLALIAPFTRCVREGEVIELIMTDDPDASPSSRVDRVFGLAFAVVAASGVVMVGDEVQVAEGAVLGKVVGFDVAHEPNHFNVVVGCANGQTGRGVGLELGSVIGFSGARAWTT